MRLNLSVRRCFFLLGVLSFATPAFATDIMQVYRDALGNDQDYLSARAAADAAAYHHEADLGSAQHRDLRLGRKRVPEACFGQKSLRRLQKGCRAQVGAVVVGVGHRGRGVNAGDAEARRADGRRCGQPCDAAAGNQDVSVGHCASLMEAV